MTRIVACLAWYAEPPKFLHRCVSSLEPFCDHLIAYDGAWDLFPGATPESSSEEWQAITDAAEENGLAFDIYAPDTVWASQVEKRALLMEEASTCGDWLFVIDGDEYVSVVNAQGLKNQLNATSLDVALVEIVRTTGYEAVNTPGAIRRLYRASCGVTVDTAHNGYRTKDGRWLHGDGAAVRLESPLDLSGYLKLHHERLNRGEERDRRAMDYRKNRLEQRSEDWRTRMPGGSR